MTGRNTKLKSREKASLSSKGGVKLYPISGNDIYHSRDMNAAFYEGFMQALLQTPEEAAGLTPLDRMAFSLMGREKSRYLNGLLDEPITFTNAKKYMSVFFKGKDSNPDRPEIDLILNNGQQQRGAAGDMKQYGWSYVRLPNYREPTEEERELIRIIGHSYVEPESFPTVSALMAHEAETSNSGVLDVAWLGVLIYEAGKIHGIRQERARRKEKKEEATGNK